jgi:DNA-binding beta-propeller fold protein YncE
MKGKHSISVLAILLVCAGLTLLQGCNDTEPTLKTATKIYMNDWWQTRAGVVYLNEPGVFETIADMEDGFFYPAGIAVDELNSKLYILQGYYTKPGKIFRKNLDGIGMLELVYDLGEGSIPSALALDVAGNKMYWADNGTHKIMRGSLDGLATPVALYEDAEVIYNGFPGLAVDVRHNKLFFSHEGLVWSSGLSGTETQDDIFSLHSGNSISAIFIDAQENKLYWADKGDHKIRVGSLDGNGMSTTLFDSSDGVDNPVALAVDKLGGKIYWSEPFHGEGGTNIIARGNLNGSGAKETIITGVKAYSIVLGYD